MYKCILEETLMKLACKQLIFVKADGGVGVAGQGGLTKHRKVHTQAEESNRDNVSLCVVLGGGVDWIFQALVKKPSARSVHRLWPDTLTTCLQANQREV